VSVAKFQLTLPHRVLYDSPKRFVTIDRTANPLMVAAPVIQVHDLAKTYEDGWLRPREIRALTGVTFDVQRGEVFGLLGPNGAGKTTFVKVLLGIIRASGGRATMLGHNAGDLHSRERVGYLPERLLIPRHHTAYTALEFYGQLSGMSLAEVKLRRDEILDLVGLSDRAGDWVRKYSKGMLQRLGLAQALIHDPDLLILDEPTDGLDPVGRSQVRAILAQLRDEGKTIFLNSHLLQEVELICDRVAILDRGQLKRVGPVEAMTAGEMTDALAEKSAKQQEKQPARVIEVEFELAGAEQGVRKALEKLNVQNWKDLGGGRFRLTTFLDDQAAVDRSVDALRTAGVSIVRLTPRRASLEDVFLAAVQGEEAKES